MMEPEEKSTVYFTIIPSNAGFTDQLLQFSTYYKLGLSLGYVYVHSNFTNRRHGAESIFDFLGFNDQFAGNRLTSREKLYGWMGVSNNFGGESKSWHRKIRDKLKYWPLHKLFFRKFNFIDIGLGDTVPVEEDAEPAAGLCALIRNVVGCNRTPDSGRKNVVRFYLTGGKFFFEKLAPALNRQLPYFPDGLDLRASYFQQEAFGSRPSQYLDGKTRLLVHIRLGDTALIETPWRSFVPLWAYWCISPLKEYADKSDRLFRKLMDVEDFALFLRKFYTLLDADDLSTVVFSDGYKAAFRDLFQKLGDLRLSNEKIRALKESAGTYEARRFSVFDEFQNCVCRVGETNEDLQQLVHAALNAEVVIVGCHQRMIPKLLATYYDSKLESPPIIISLHKGIEPRYGLEIGLTPEKARVYSVNVTDLESDQGLIDAVNEIKRRQTKRGP